MTEDLVDRAVADPDDALGLEPLDLDGVWRTALQIAEQRAGVVESPGLQVLYSLDDVPGGHVRRGRDRAVELGFVELYPLGSGVVMQRRSS